ncbi:MAG TPA: Gfo/Idh/MocA family oxidoreductase [Planctomycetota bacterium]
MRERAIDRRQFVKAAGAGLAAPFVLRNPASLRRTPANETLGLGIIGMGIRARNVMNGFLLNDARVRILAVCEVDGTRREHYRGEIDKHYGNADCAAYVDYGDLLARDDIDAVVITTPDHWHVTQAIHAAQAGKDVYCEKPLTHTLREGRRLIEAVAKHGTVFQTGSQQRSEYGHRFVKAVEFIRNGGIGKLLTVHVGVGDPTRICELPAEDLEPGLDWERWQGPVPARPYHSDLSPRGVHGHYPDWRAYGEYCGGYLADMGAHHFDIAQWALDADSSGPIGVSLPRDGDRKRGATLHYANGVDVVHGGPNGATFIGTNGMVAVDRGRLSAVPGHDFDAPAEAGAEPLAFTLPRNVSHVDDWIQCIHSRATPICSAEIGARTAAVCQLLNLAYRHGRSFQWDPVAWKFEGENLPAGLMDYQRRDAFPLPRG